MKLRRKILVAEAWFFWWVARQWGELRQRGWISAKPDVEETMGISWLWALTKHPFLPAAIAHDRAYSTLAKGETTKWIDNVFLGDMLKIAEGK